MGTIGFDAFDNPERNCYKIARYVEIISNLDILSIR